MSLTGDWSGAFAEAGGLWRHDGEASRPHALLTSGLHSDGYVNATKLIEQPGLLERVVRDWADLIRRQPAAPPDWVAGAALGAVTLAYEFARQLGCRAAFTEPHEGALLLKRFTWPANARVLVVEDVVTTGGSTRSTIAACEAAGAVVAPEVFALVDRSDGSVLAPRRIVPATRVAVQTWKPEECPLCRQGSEALRPKANWGRLTGS